MPRKNDPRSPRTHGDLPALAVPALESNGVRVLVRLGHAQEGTRYRATWRSATAALAPFSDRGVRWLMRAYGVLRLDGRATCKQNHPACDECPLAETCPSVA